MSELAVYDVVGLERLISTLENLPPDLAKIAPIDAANVIGQEAQKRSPKRRGRLAGSWSAGATDGKLTFGFNAPYAAPINWGTGPRKGKRGPHNIAETLFFTGALSDKREEWKSKYLPPTEEAVSKVKGA